MKPEFFKKKKSAHFIVDLQFKGIRLTLILLTSTKWWAPASVSKWRMGFNSAFKGLRRAAVSLDVKFHSHTTDYETYSAVRSSESYTVTYLNPHNEHNPYTLASRLKFLDTRSKFLPTTTRKTDIGCKAKL
jgi:hypothetical protein